MLFLSSTHIISAAMQVFSVASTLPLAAAGVIVIASVTLNAAHSKRNQNPKHRRSSGSLGSLSNISSGGSGGGGNTGSGSGASSVNFNRPMLFPSPEFQPSLSSARASPPRQLPYTLSRNNARHTRIHSLNRNVPHTPSATVSMAEVLHSRNPFPGPPTTRVSQAGVQPAGPPTKGGTRRCMIFCKLYPIVPHYRADANSEVPIFSRPLSIPISLRD